MFLTNVFHVVKVTLEYIRNHNKSSNTLPIDEIEAWKTVCLGSDNDGIIDPFDNFKTAADLPAFRAACCQALNDYVLPEYQGYNVVSLPNEHQMTLQEIDALMINQPIVEAMDKVFYDNTHAFLKKYFTKQYLGQEASDFIV
ncbi:hypothetical protein N7U66_02055 [Lacinutrix neustonica]|uniref:Uncharacterized protein n=1 Tax=Lacinutrix neustonica TaxID=2980107 RepID=A0A9E8MYD0_9FLAO|nr:hypothetical protein [Lacinutrix neustonica]WAC02520.1 hypothetical protein N7U66_02055 [Lacinutrix neustonica]